MPESSGLDLSARDALVRLLLCAAAMKDSGLRSLVVQRLPTEITIRLHEFDTPLAIVTNLVAVCNEHPDGIAALVNALRHFEGASKAMEAIDSWRATMARQSVPPTGAPEPQEPDHRTERKTGLTSVVVSISMLALILALAASYHHLGGRSFVHGPGTDQEANWRGWGQSYLTQISVTFVFTSSGERLTIDLPLDLQCAKAARHVVREHYLGALRNGRKATYLDEAIYWIRKDGTKCQHESLRDAGISQGDELRIGYRIPEGTIVPSDR